MRKSDIGVRGSITACWLVLLIGLPATASAADDSPISGIVTVDGASVEPTHGIALETQNRWTKEKLIKVILAPGPIERDGIDAALDRLSHLTGQLSGEYAIVTLTPEGEVRMVYAYLAGTNYGIGTETGAEPISVSEGRVAGRVFTAEPGDLMGSAYEYDLTFAVDLIPARSPGEDLGAGGGPPGAAFVALHTAMREGDIDTLVQHVAAFRVAGLAAQDEASRSYRVDYLKEQAHQAVEVLGGELFGDFAILEVEATDAWGDSVEGSVKMVLDGDSWRYEIDDLM